MRAVIRLPVIRVAARHPFARIAFAREARRLAAGGLVGRFREAGTGLAIVLAVRGAAGSYAVAGTAGAAYLLAAAVSRPAHGRLIDKAGPAGACSWPRSPIAWRSLALRWRYGPMAALGCCWPPQRSSA
jgi:hypothetical protein